jgi:Zn-dependent protease
MNPCWCARAGATRRGSASVPSPRGALAPPRLRQSPRGHCQLIQTVAIYALPVLFAITVHEAAHGYAARHFGDNTAYALGRITLNPIKHIDPVGTILMPLLLYFATSGAFCSVMPSRCRCAFGNLRNPKRHMVWVALAGPGANLVQALFVGPVAWC